MCINWKEVSFSDIEIIRTLGSGGFGTCYEGRYEQQVICVKLLNKTAKKKAAMQSYEAETRKEYFLFDHPNIVKILSASSLEAVTEASVATEMIIFEFIDGKSLQSVLDDTEQSIDLEQMCRFGYEIASALEYVHMFRIAHLDVKPANVMVDANENCKLVDFGCSQYIEEDPITPTRSCLTGTFAYRAPELLRGGSPSSKCDVYAMGICLWQFWSRRFPFSGMNQHAVIFQVVSKQLRPKFEDGGEVNTAYKVLAERCWSSNPEQRPSMSKVMMELSLIKNQECDTSETADLVSCDRSCKSFGNFRSQTCDTETRPPESNEARKDDEVNNTESSIHHLKNPSSDRKNRKVVALQSESEDQDDCDDTEEFISSCMHCATCAKSERERNKSICKCSAINVRPPMNERSTTHTRKRKLAVASMQDGDVKRLRDGVS